MPIVQYREADKSDIPGMALIRTGEWGTEEYWNMRIAGYMNGELHPQQALLPRILYVATKSGNIVGFIAGHLTRRFACDGELQWINVMPEYRKKGIASELFRLLVTWFIDRKSLRICVNVDTDNLMARYFYSRHGAEELNKYWLYWKDISVVLEKR